MALPPGSPSSRHSSKTDRWIVNYLTLAAGLFAFTYVVAYVWNSDYGTRAVASVLALLALVKAIMSPPTHGVLRGRSMVFLSLMFCVALLNTVVSADMTQTALRWVLWFGMVMSFSRIVGSCDGSWMASLIQRLPYLFTFIYVTIIIEAHYSTNSVNVAFAYHLSGLYGNLILASGLFSLRFWGRSLWVAVGLLAIFFSGAGGALFTIPIMFVPYILYSASSMPVKGIAVAGLLMLGATFFLESNLFGHFLNIKLSNGADSSYSGLDRLERSKEMRLQLVQYGLNLAQQHPLGTGLGHTYQESISHDMGVGHVHNGTITMLIELGFPGFAVSLSMLLWVFSTILSSRTINNQVKGFYFTYFFTIFGRSLSENYTPLDLGNFFNFVFLITTAYFFLYERRTQLGLGLPTGPGGYPRMMGPPPMAMPPARTWPPPSQRPAPPRPVAIH